MYDTKPYFYGTGRRKSSVARVRILPGTGVITINGRDIDDYFGLDTLKLIVRQPLEATETTGKFDLIVRVGGGGVDPRPPYEGKKEVRPQGRAPCASVLQEITRASAAKKYAPQRLGILRSICFSFQKEGRAKRAPLAVFSAKAQTKSCAALPIDQRRKCD